MKKLQIVSILCVLGCMFSIIGCTPKKPSPSGSGTTSVSSANNDVVRSDGTIDPAGKTDLKGKEILVFGNLIPKKEDANYEEMKEYFDSVCEKLGCTVKCSEPDSWETFIDTFRTQVMAGDFAGDIVAYGTQGYPSLMINGLLLPMEGLVDMSSDLWVKSLQNDLTWKDKLYGVSPNLPQIPNTMIFYNKDLFEEFGIFEKYDFKKLIAEKKWDWDVFEQLCKDCTKTSGGTTSVWGIGGAGPTGLSLCDNLIRSNGGDYVKKKGDKVYFSLGDPEAKKAMEFVHKLVWTDKVTGTDNYWATWETEKYFREGLCAMYMNQTFYGADYKKSLDFDFGMLPIPKGPDASDYTAVALNPVIYGIPANAKNPAPAVAFLEYFIENHPQRKDGVKAAAMGVAPDDQSLEYIEMMSTKLHYTFAGYTSLQNLNWSDHGVLTKTPPSTIIEQYRAEIQGEIDALWSKADK